MDYQVKPGAQPLSKEEFIAQADAICADGVERELALGPRPPTGDAERFERWWTDFQAIALEGLTEIDALVPPSEDAETISAMFSNLRAAVIAIPETVVAGALGRDTDPAAMAAAAEQRIRWTSQAAVYGLDDRLGFALAADTDR